MTCTGRRFNKKPRPRRRRERRRGSNASQFTIECCSKSVILEQFVAMGFVSSFCSSFHSPNMKSAGYLACNTSQRQRRPCTECQEGSRIRSSHTWNEQEESLTRNGGHQRGGNVAFPRHLSATKVSPGASVLGVHTVLKW